MSELRDYAEMKLKGKILDKEVGELLCRMAAGIPGQAGDAVGLIETIEQHTKGDNTMDFQNAVEAMKLGVKVRRLSWNSDEYITPLRHFIRFHKGIDHAIWQPELDDFKADDWFVMV